MNQELFQQIHQILPELLGFTACSVIAGVLLIPLGKTVLRGLFKPARKVLAMSPLGHYVESEVPKDRAWRTRIVLPHLEKGDVKHDLFQCKVWTDNFGCVWVAPEPSYWRYFRFTDQDTAEVRRTAKALEEEKNKAQQVVVTDPPLQSVGERMRALLTFTPAGLNFHQFKKGEEYTVHAQTNRMLNLRGVYLDSNGRPVTHSFWFSRRLCKEMAHKFISLPPK